MTVLDWAIVAFTLALALWGYRQGLIVGALTLVGFGVGAFLGSRLGPILLSQGADSPYAPLCGAIGALLVGALSAVALEGLALALRRRLIRRPVLHRADGAGGAALIGAVALGMAWVFGAVALHAPGTTQLRADVQNSVILRELDHVLPPTGGVLNVLDRVDPAPSITGPATPTERPDPKIAADPDVAPRRRLGGAGAEHRLRARHRGLGLGGAAEPDRHQRPRRRRRRRHHGDHPERGGARRDRGLLPARRRPGAAAGRRRAADPADRLERARPGRPRRSSATPRTVPTR